VCPHCQASTSIFGDTGGRRIAEEYGVPLLAQLPLDPETRVAGDEGLPITLRKPESAQAAAFRALAQAVAERADATAALGTLPRIG
jgi:ATP-binding protein involved in chromosome partitioning